MSIDLTIGQRDPPGEGCERDELGGKTESARHGGGQNSDPGLCCRMFRRPPSASLWLALMACAAGCGSAEDSASDAAGSTVSCSADPRLDTYAGELDKPGELGLLSFRFFDLDPAPPAKGNNTFHVEVNDAAGEVVQGALRVDLRMPDHGHGSSVDPVIVFDAALGAYDVRPVYLFMPGVWRLEFEALDAADGAAMADDALMLDRTTLHFCIEG